MGDFNTALKYVLEREGGLVESKNDPGGTTLHGISLRLLRELPIERLRAYDLGSPVEEDTVKNLSNSQIGMIYYGEFWEKAAFAGLKNQSVCNYIFDMAVNHGVAQAIKLAQRALWAITETKDFVPDTGILDSRTIEELNWLEEPQLRTALVAERAGFMRLVAKERPQEGEFLNGWLNRAYRFDDSKDSA